MTKSQSKTLSNYFQLNRRYSRSINLERDLVKQDSLEGYVLTERAVDALRRILAGLTNPQGNQAWTLTSVYGTGKSAFAHYLACICANNKSYSRKKALEITAEKLGTDSPEYDFCNKIPQQGLFIAVATAQREAVSNTIIRALQTGVEKFWTPTKRSKTVAKKITDLVCEIDAGNTVDSREIPPLIQEIAEFAKTDVLLIIDELGKNLEYAVYNQGAEDLYLLQQIAELPTTNKNNHVYILGVLHQAFTDYGERLASVQRNEWAKIQGRFEDIPFRDLPAQMMRLIGQAIEAKPAQKVSSKISQAAQKWFDILPDDIVSDTTPEIIASTYPLHPIAALVLPTLCTRYAQNDRSLFTFLTSAEPFSFPSFLEETTFVQDTLPTLKLARVYDYFIEAVGMGLASRPNLQRWLEIQGLIADAQHLDSDSLQVLKTIGTLNLITTTGSMRATRKMVALAMCDSADDERALQSWELEIDTLLKKNLITHRRQLDELRIWQGSDFNVDGELVTYIEQERSPLVELLSELRPLKPLVAQSHSYKTGTLRYFERQYLDRSRKFSELVCSDPSIDGFVGYWVDDTTPKKVPPLTADGKPLILVAAGELDLLRITTREFAALTTLNKSAPELQTDGVARREVRYRLAQAETALDENLEQAFDVSMPENLCWVNGRRKTIDRVTDFNAQLSKVCDEIYNKSPILWNELINRRELTPQGAGARRTLIEAMLERAEEERLGLDGYGPEVSIYYSVLHETGIHRAEEGEWGFYPPAEDSKLWYLWEAIEEFCLGATEKTKTFELLNQELAKPPYGVKEGVIPIVLAAVLLYHVDDFAVYKEGTFLTVLGSEDFDLMVKYPSQYGVKYFELVGARSQVFKELEAILRQSKAKKSDKLRNATLLSVVKPLIQFMNKLPKYTQETERMMPEAKAVLKALKNTTEPDKLLFMELPKACNLAPIRTKEEDDTEIAKALKQKLVQALKEIHTTYDKMLKDCHKLLYEAFGVREQKAKLREDLAVRANYISGKCVESVLKRFTQAAIDTTTTDEQWLQAIVMIIADQPPESWQDSDVTAFEMKLADIARRFKNMEALQEEVKTTGKEVEARKITITRPDGNETHQMVWIEKEQKQISQIELLIEKTLNDDLLRDNPQLQQTSLARFTERIFRTNSG